MVRRLEVSGGDGKLAIQLDGVERASFGFSEGVNASELYDALDFKPGDRYELVRGGAGELPADTFEAFCKMMENIIRGINALAEGLQAEPTL